MTVHAGTSDELTRLQAAVDSLQAEMRELRRAEGKRSVRRTRARGRTGRRVAVLGGITLAVGIMGVAAASTPGNPADVTYIPLSVPHKVLSASIGAGVTKSVAVIGGSTTVPTDASSVELTVTVKSNAAGTLSVFPTDHASSTTADTITFPSGGVLVTQVSKQSPGLSSKVSFTNNGTAAATVTATITGYSTQTTASNVSGSGGSAGQVLTNNGAGGASWQNVSAGTTNIADGSVTTAKLSASGSTAGQVLTSTGGTVAWAVPKVSGYQLVLGPLLFNAPNTQASGTASCPAGKVLVGGGAVSGATAPGVQDLNSSYPTNSTTWQVYVDNTDTVTHSYEVYAICVNG